MSTYTHKIGAQQCEISGSLIVVLMRDTTIPSGGKRDPSSYIVTLPSIFRHCLLPPPLEIFGDKGGIHRHHEGGYVGVAEEESIGWHNANERCVFRDTPRSKDPKHSPQ